METLSLKSVIRNAVDGWRTEWTKDRIATAVARKYHRINMIDEVNVQCKELLKVVSSASVKNNEQNFFRYIERTSIEAKATIMDLLPAILSAMPTNRGCTMLNNFLNPLGFSVAVIGSSACTINRDRILAQHEKETSEAKVALLLLGENASIDELRNAYKEVQEAKGSHKLLLEYLEGLISLNHAA
ncbi:toxin YdaT family protein [Candidatus Enterovibrio escicola]|uniref:toxin YdaT family protein n=1 Tax=Candidatus Enterovibrio escicola TaxID=1927127 RepID=UPI00123818DB|nr:toxin YdaT family protein [Candidatus Enterovibrio escacola]